MEAVGSEGAAERQHVHHSYIWLGGLRAFFIVLVAIVVSSFGSVVSIVAELGSGADFSVALAMPIIVGGIIVLLLVIFGITVGVRALSWKHLWYEVGPAEFSVYSGILNKKRVHVPYQRIQSVDQRATLVQRVFGVCTVSIDTAGGSNNKAVLVPYVTKNQAESLRRELFARKQGLATGVTAGVAADGAAASAAALAPSASNVLDVGDQAWAEVGGLFAGSAVDTGQVTYEYGLSNKELLLSGISGNSGFVAVVFVVFAGLCSLATTTFDLFPGSDDLLVDTTMALAAQQGVELVVGWFAAAVVGLAVVGWLLSILSTCLSYGGFHARRRDDRIEVERGLLQHQFQGVSVARVQSVEVKQGFIRRLMGYCEISLGRVDAGGDSDDGSQKSGTQQGVVIHPFVKRARVNEILAGLLPEFADLPAETDRVPVAPVALRRGIIRRSIWQGNGFWLALCIAAIQLGVHWVVGTDGTLAESDALAVIGWTDLGATALYVLAAVLFVLDIVGSVLWFRESSFAVNRRFMSVTNGGFSTETTNFPRNKVQFGFTKTNPFQRLAGTATINARTAAGVGGTTVRLIDAREDDAARWLAWLEPGGAR